MKLDDSVETIKGVGKALGNKFQMLNIETVGDLVRYYPRRYDDYSNIQKIANITPGNVSIRVQIKQVKGRYIRGGLHITEAVASDDSGSVKIVWFNQPYRANATKANSEYFVSGLFDFKRGRLSITNPSMELVSNFPTSTARIVPIYRETKGLTSFQIRKAVKEALSSIKKVNEVLPQWVISNNKLLSKLEAWRLIHYPRTTTDIDHAKYSLGFEELFELILTGLVTKQTIAGETATAIPIDEKLAKEFVDKLPFRLTDAQRKVIWRILQDLEKTQPMNRLVEGDVGAGKTLVAAMVAAMVMKKGYSVAFMAPTELLARQHANTIYELMKPIGMHGHVNLLVGSMKAKQKTTARKALKQSEPQLAVGTHALIQRQVDLPGLALAIVDEQHRFGVDQRKTLLSKAGTTPHLLSLTATPIPRSLALTVYGELDISVLDEKPKQRKPIITELVLSGDRTKVYKHVDKEIEAGRQVFVVCPVIEESDVLVAKSVTKTFEDLKTGPFKLRHVGLLHGRMKTEDKQRVMEQFASGKLDILVSTTVVEVGVDVPNATVMLIESPERFGLAQIHQLRGRVGRSEHQGFCYLLLDPGQQLTPRLRAVAQTNDGFKLAELDLKLRGPGAIYGTLQHGQLDLRVANITDPRLVAKARSAANEFIERGEDLLQYPQLSRRVHQLQTITHLN